MGKILLGLAVIFFGFNLYASPVELTPRAAAGDMQFGFSCGYFSKQDMEWSTLMTVNEALPTQLFVAVLSNKTGKYLTAWQMLTITNGLIYVRKTDYDEASILLPSLSDSEVHFKTNLDSAEVSFVFPLGKYRMKYPAYFIDNTNPSKACKITSGDLPKN